MKSTELRDQAVELGDLGRVAFAGEQLLQVRVTPRSASVQPLQLLFAQREVLRHAALWRGHWSFHRRSVARTFGRSEVRVAVQWKLSSLRLRFSAVLQRSRS